MPEPLPYQHAGTPAMQATPAADGEEAELSGYLNTLLAQRRLILAVTALVLLAGIAYAFLARPVYEANVLIHVEEESPKESRNLLAESGSMFSMKTSASAEIELFQSRLVISRAIDRLSLDISGEPEYLPLIGKWLARYSGRLPAPGWVRDRGYAWGGEQIRIGSFSVPEEFLNRDFQLTLEPGDRYRIVEALSGFAAAGHVGQPQAFDLPNGRIALQIEQIAARPGTRFILRHSSRQMMIDDILKRMQVSEQGKQSGIIRAALQGGDALQVNDLLGEIARAYISQNAARKTQEADSALAFLEQQLPEMKRQLDLAETRHAEFRTRHSMVDLGEDARISLQQSAAIKTRRIELEQKRRELLIRFTGEHPYVQAIDEQLLTLNVEIRALAAHVRTLPLLEQELVRLARDVKVNTELYTALLNTGRQLRLTTVAKTSNVRLVDMPLKPERPVSPNRPRIVGVSLLAGLMLGVLAAFVRKSLQSAIDDPAEIEHMLGMPVFAAIPHSKAQAELLARAAQAGQADQARLARRPVWMRRSLPSLPSPRLPLLASSAPGDAAIESLRTFHTVLQYRLSGLRRKIVLFTGPTPGTGKSFVCANLAVLLGGAGKRVLLIDADLRKGHLHSYFGLPRAPGLSEAIAGGTAVEGAIRRAVQANMDFLSTGTLPGESPELLMRPVLGAMLAALESRYDIILIDSAPLLGISDAIILGMHAGAIYLLTRAGVTTPSDMAESLRRLDQAGLGAVGFLFNGMPPRGRQYGYGARYGKQWQWRA